MPEAPFVHLHVHSEYSILDRACRVPELAARAAEFEMPAVALTDHGSLAGSVQLYKETRKHGVKPVFGCEVYVADDRKAQQKGYAHLTLLAKDNVGYGNLIKLSSLGFLEGYRYKPRVKRQKEGEATDRSLTALIVEGQQTVSSEARQFRRVLARVRASCRPVRPDSASGPSLAASESPKKDPCKFKKKETIMSSSNDDRRFAAVPLEFLLALERGDITLDQWALGAFLVGRADFIRNEASYTLRALADLVGWRKSLESLRLALAGLRDADWISFEVRQGQRSPYLISLERLFRGRRADAGGETSKDDPPF